MISTENSDPQIEAGVDVNERAAVVESQLQNKKRGRSRKEESQKNNLLVI